MIYRGKGEISKGAVALNLMAALVLRQMWNINTCAQHEWLRAVSLTNGRTRNEECEKEKHEPKTD